MHVTLLKGREKKFQNSPGPWPHRKVTYFGVPEVNQVFVFVYLVLPAMSNAAAYPSLLDGVFRIPDSVFRTRSRLSP